MMKLKITDFTKILKNGVQRLFASLKVIQSNMKK